MSKGQHIEWFYCFGVHLCLVAGQATVVHGDESTLRSDLPAVESTPDDKDSDAQSAKDSNTDEYSLTAARIRQPQPEVEPSIE